MDKLENASHHLLSTINAILDLSKIEAGKFALEDVEVHIDRIVNNVLSMLQERAKAKGLKLQAEIAPLPVRLIGDATRLQQALLNYAANAVKFTENGEVTLRVQLEDEDSSSVQIRFSVSDSGIGIAPEILPRLFNAFEQADNSMTRQFGGTGLGLAITRKIAEMMGGQAGAESSQGQGSTFWFTARLKRARPNEDPDLPDEPPSQAIGHQHPAGCRILIVEDEPINREITLDLLGDLADIVDIAENGAQAVDLATQHTYDLILMDMQMPVMDGLQATRRIRQLPHGAAIPIVAMTANAFAEDRQQCIAAGMDDFIAKPINPERLAAIVAHWAKAAASR